MTKPAHASEVIFPSQVNKLTSTSAQSPETISKEDQIPTIDDLQGKERVIPVYEESSEPSGSNLPVQRMHNLPQPETLVSSKVTTSSKNLEPSVKMVDFQGGQCQVDESFLPLLEQACDKMPHLLECQKRYSARFSCCAFSCLGQVLFLLRNMKIKDMVNHKDELELFWEEAKAMKFDLEWLSPAVERALSTTLVEEVSKICELQKEVQMFEDKIAAAKMEIASLDAKIDVAKMEIASLEDQDGCCWLLLLIN
ncbi:Ubiquitin carboxyl-terminal hydrolase family protein [Quillaja saponaria]|uniref:Ubiquitin carboxyl-terminal hydrolase family protein n=1 Tax=Quillaja saponaria TaxID=32244 RepID=A0AAD7QAX3_QUISA|nr:Ubiquitin carboxyl-terminal hydrolase family protein [Quillaja saponaria]